MPTLTDKSQFQAQLIKLGQHKLASVHQEIMDWISKQFGVRAWDFLCEKRVTPKGSQQVVHVILETAEDVKKIHASRADHPLIAERYLKYFKSMDSLSHLHDPLKNNVFPLETDPFPEIIVTFRPLKYPEEKIIRAMLEEEERAILKTFETVWTMSMAVVFYYTDVQVKENLANGTSAKINEALLDVGVKYRFDRGSSYRFDSKETFDRDYESNWYYYWK